MPATTVADLLILLHFAFILFVLFGGLLVLKWDKIAVLHLPCALWGVLVELCNWYCPLTPLELHYRSLAGEAGYHGGFIEHYLEPLIYPAGLSQDLQIAFGLLALAFNLGIYGLVLRKRLAKKKRRSL